MAAVSAAAARREARALRAESQRLRRDARAGVFVARRRLDICLRESARTAELSVRPRPSPWSDLPWEPSLDALDQVLVAL